MQQLLIYNPAPHPRKSYIFDLVFHRILGIARVEETPNLLHFRQKKGVAKLNYSVSSMQDIPYFGAHAFMDSDAIAPIFLDVADYEKLPAAFYHHRPKTDWPFDVFAWCFFLVSRYEEYLPFDADEHGRFTAHQSVAYQEVFLDLPLVNLWAFKLRALLQKYYPTLAFEAAAYQFTPTYDIDHAFAFLKKGVVRQFGAMLRNLKNGDHESLRLQWATWLRLRSDPYFVFDYLQSLDEQYQLHPKYFWLVGDYGTHDKNIHYKNKAFRQLIQQIAAQHPIGIHPSYQSNEDSLLLDQEINRLEDISGKRIDSNRQHYLRLRFPETYENLVHYKIKEDYTMGYAQEMGFRASIATPFYWFNLRKNEATDLLVYPFQIMDVTLNVYQQLSPEAAITKAQKIIHQTQKVNGHLITIWHNSSLCEAWNWKDWRQVYEAIIEAGTHL